MLIQKNSRLRISTSCNFIAEYLRILVVLTENNRLFVITDNLRVLWGTATNWKFKKFNVELTKNTKIRADISRNSKILTN